MFNYLYYNPDSLSSDRSGYRICSLQYCPTRPEVVFADVEGHWGLVEGLETAAGGAVAEKEEVREAVGMEAEDLEGLFQDDDDDDDENSFSISRIQAETGWTKDEEGNLVVAGMAAEDGDVRPGSAASSTGVAAPPPPPPPQPRVELQEPFQPGASPAHLAARFLVYNNVGVVKAYTGDGENSLDVEFHDSSVHHPLHLPNPANHR